MTDEEVARLKRIEQAAIRARDTLADLCSDARVIRGVIPKQDALFALTSLTEALGAIHEGTTD